MNHRSRVADDVLGDSAGLGVAVGRMQLLKAATGHVRREDARLHPWPEAEGLCSGCQRHSRDAF